ncbi:Uncharacterised protein [Mycobacteroides abscessus subsp. abscessus]|nr:Uncharacterised protein [Mycobacteroides abscessus subsp. abscessus]
MRPKVIAAPIIIELEIGLPWWANCSSPQDLRSPARTCACIRRTRTVSLNGCA